MNNKKYIIQQLKDSGYIDTMWQENLILNFVESGIRGGYIISDNEYISQAKSMITLANAIDEKD